LISKSIRGLHFQIDQRFLNCNRDHDSDQKSIRINRDPILIAEPDSGSSGKFDPCIFSPKQKFFRGSFFFGSRSKGVRQAANSIPQHIPEITTIKKK
jgi:hypothetical protein